MADSRVVLRGCIVAERYRDADGTWAIVNVRIIAPDGNLGHMITAKGHIPRANKQEILEFVGDWKEDPKYGRQFDVIEAFYKLPNTPEELEAYLGTHMKGSGIGPAKAKAIVNHFKGDTVKILSEQPEKLVEVKGITYSIVERVKALWNQESNNRPAEMWLAMRGVSKSMSRRLIEHFGNQVIQILQDNPYRATEVNGFGFKKADEVAEGMEFPKASPQRTEAAVVYVLQESTNKGHAFLHRGQLIEEVIKITDRPEKDVVAAIDACVVSNKVGKEEADSGQGHKLVVYYLPYLLRAEKELANRINELVSYPHEIPLTLEEVLPRVQNAMQTPFSPLQIEGVRAAFENHVSIVTGGPGTGKSTLVKGLVGIADRLGINYLLAAPTGRAAKRLAEVTGKESQTIHRMLKFDAINFCFSKNRNNPLEAELIIVDEGSMLELTLARSLFEAIPDTASLVIIGDVDQLPAVGPGMVLKDLINSDVIKVTRLDTIFRQAEGSRIITNAHRIRQGLIPQFPEVKGTKSDSFFMKVPRIWDEEKQKSVDNLEWIRNTLIGLCKDHIPKRLGADPIRDVQVLLPMKIGDAGTRELNGLLQKALNESGEEFEVRGGVFRVGDRVMQFRNNYTLDVFNGDIGFIQSWDEEKGIILIDFYGRTIEYPECSTNDLQLAYAQTIHKSQGSEYPVTIIILVSQHFVMLERNLLYTASTRAKKMCLFVASDWAIKTAVENSQVQARNSFLAARVRSAVQLEVA